MCQGAEGARVRMCAYAPFLKCALRSLSAHRLFVALAQLLLAHRGACGMGGGDTRASSVLTLHRDVKINGRAGHVNARAFAVCCRRCEYRCRCCDRAKVSRCTGPMGPRTGAYLLECARHALLLARNVQRRGDHALDGAACHVPRATCHVSRATCARQMYEHAG